MTSSESATGINTPVLSSKHPLLARARKVIPGCSQAFSKGLDQYPQSVCPHYLVRGSGVESKTRTATTTSTSPWACVRSSSDTPIPMSTEPSPEMADGTIFTLSHPFEVELAELLVDTLPCAEMVRYGKNGSDATTGAVRLARAFTGRDRIAWCGYHGWPDSYIGTTTRNLGVPQQVAELTHTFPYDDVGALEVVLNTHPGEFACLIMEPTTINPPSAGYLETVKQLCARHGALLVFDEIVTGFRLAIRGAQEYFGVTPDLACFGKAMANGFPVSVVGGHDCKTSPARRPPAALGAGKQDHRRLQRRCGDTGSERTHALRRLRSSQRASVHNLGRRRRPGVEDPVPAGVHATRHS